MFENPAKKIKSTANILFWILIAASIFLAFDHGIVEEYEYPDYDDYLSKYYYEQSDHSDPETHFEAEIFFSYLIGGMLGSYIISLLIYGFGELIETQTTISGNPSSANPTQTTISGNPSSATPTQAQINKFSVSSQPAINKPSTPPVSRASVATGYVLCPKCGCSNRPGRKTCWECQTPLTPGESK